MSERYWYWSPDIPETLEVGLEHYGFEGTACVRSENRMLLTIVFRDSNIPPQLESDVVYRIGQRLFSEYPTGVPVEIRKMLFPVKAEDMDEAMDAIVRGVDKISKSFFEILKMNEYYDDIVYNTDCGMKVLDYFIKVLRENREIVGEGVDQRLAELSFKRSYLLGLKMHVYN